MRRLENQAERAQRYSHALVTASLAVQRSVARPGGAGAARHAWWRAQPSLGADHATAQPRVFEA
jgi:hypothetical protein